MDKYNPYAIIQVLRFEFYYVKKKNCVVNF